MTANNTTTRCTAGFTLLELLVAIALMDVIAVALYASMHTGFKTRQNCRATLAPYRTVTPVFEIIRQDLSSAMQPDGILAGLFVGQDVPYSSLQDADTVSFYTAGYRPKTDEITSNVIHVQYAMELDNEREQVVLKRLTTKNILTPTAADPDEEVIARDIAGLKLEYFDGASWLESWDSSEHDGTLPLGVRVTIAILDKNRSRFSKNDDPHRYFTRIFPLTLAKFASETEQEP